MFLNSDTKKRLVFKLSVSDNLPLCNACIN